MSTATRCFFICILALSMPSCKKEEPKVAAYEQYAVQKESIAKVLAISGKIEPATKVAITAPLGNKIKSLRVQLGQKVKKGDVLLQYDETAVLSEVTKIRTSMASKRAELTNADIQIQANRKRLERAKALFNKKIGPQKDVEDAERDLTTSLNSYNARKMEGKTDKEVLDKAEESMRSTEIRSPIAGTVTSLWLGNDTFTPGTSVKEGEKLITVSDVDRFVVDAKIPEADASKISPSLGVAITLDAVPGVEYEGKIARIAPTPEVDQSSGLALFPIRILLSNPDERVRYGMSAVCNIQVENKENAIVVPLNAVKNDGSTEYVEIVEDGVLSKRPVKLGITSDMSAEVIEGLKEGEKVKVP